MGGLRMGDEQVSAAPGTATSLFVLDNIPEEMCFESPLWGEIPVSGEVACAEGGRLFFRVAHDIVNLYLRIESTEADVKALRSGRNAQIGHLYLDDAVEVTLTPTWAPGPWTLRINPSGEAEWLMPEGATVAPRTLIENSLTGASWNIFLSVPFIDLFSGGDAAGTPVAGETWGFNVGRTTPGPAPTASRWIGSGDVTKASGAGRLEFFGGPTRRRASLDAYSPPSFGVNTVKFDFETSVKDGALASMDPPPAERLRTRTKAHMRFRVAKPWAYRVWIDIAEEPAPEIDPEDEYEEEPGEEEEPKEPPRGESACRYGVAFELTDVWSELESMEDIVNILRARLEQSGKQATPQLQASIGFFEGTLIRVDRFRSPNVRESLTDDLWGQLRTLYDASVAGMRALLLEAGAMHVVSPYAGEGHWYKAALHITPGDLPPSELATKYSQAGYKILAFAVPYTGGRAGGIDPSLTGMTDLVILPAADAGEHLRFLALGVPSCELAASSYSYELIGRTAAAGGASFLAALQGDAYPLPPEATGLLGVEGDFRLWDKYLSAGALTMLFLHAEPTSKAPGDEALKERFNMVLATDLTREAALEAISAGRFYGSTGPIISAIEVTGPTVTVRSQAPAHITFIGKGGEVLSGKMGTEASYTFDGSKDYVRASVLADVDPDGFRREALTQPFVLSPDVIDGVAQSGAAAEDDTQEEEPERAPYDPNLSMPVGAVTTVLDDFIDEGPADDEPEETPAQSPSPSDPGPDTNATGA